MGKRHSCGVWHVKWLINICVAWLIRGANIECRHRKERHSCGLLHVTWLIHVCATWHIHGANTGRSNTTETLLWHSIRGVTHSCVWDMTPSWWKHRCWNRKENTPVVYCMWCDSFIWMSRGSFVAQTLGVETGRRYRVAKTHRMP